MTKAEMQLHASEYERLGQCAIALEAKFHLREAIDNALAGIGHLDGALRHHAANESQIDSLAIDVVLRCCPPLFYFQGLKRLEEVANSSKRTQKAFDGQLVSQISRAREAMDVYRDVWALLESQGGAGLSAVKGWSETTRTAAFSALRSWQQMGVLGRDGESLGFVTRMGQVIEGKCTRCGDRASAPKGMLLERMTCPSCKQSVSFVLLGSA